MVGYTYMKVALVHDYLSQDGGAERVVDALQDMWPDAPLFTLFYDRTSAHPRFQKRRITTSFLQKIPGIKKYYQWMLPLMPYATESYDLSEFDVVISSTSAFAKGIIIHPGTIHICYCHTPTRFLWGDSQQYVNDSNHPWLIKKFLPIYLSRLRLWDTSACARVTTFIANSKTVAERIQTYYLRDSDVIYPPVDTHLYQPLAQKGEYFLTGGRLVAYKNFDIVVKACTRLALPLVVFGDGPIQHQLKKIAGKTIKFVGRVSDMQKATLYAHAKAFIHPQNEDFGITPIESMASGRPVIAYKKGGATETVIEGVTGVFFHDQTWESCAHTLLNFDESSFNQQNLIEHSQRFSRYLFKVQMRKFVERVWNEHQEKTKALSETSSESDFASIKKLLTQKTTLFS